MLLAANSSRMTTDKRRQVVEDDLRALEEAHQLELEKKVELERTVDNQRQQLRSGRSVRDGVWPPWPATLFASCNGRLPEVSMVKEWAVVRKQPSLS